MENFFSLEYGIGGLCIILTLMVLLKVGEFLWNIHEKSGAISSASIEKLTAAVTENTSAVMKLDYRLEHLEKSVSDLPKFKEDIRKFYLAIKELSGDNWPKIRDEILKDNVIL